MNRRYNDDGTMVQSGVVYTRGDDGWWHSTTPDRDGEWTMTPVNDRDPPPPGSDANTNL